MHGSYQRYIKIINQKIKYNSWRKTNKDQGAKEVDKNAERKTLVPQRPYPGLDAELNGLAYSLLCEGLLFVIFSRSNAEVFRYTSTQSGFSPMALK
ncbi:hypothetical protein PHISCL_03507 [Aspergillus sclerotialis]|uniref:Uncharacterized protein n=1 Tax=Aspergillus sclerotialis TaxID=2070753 RepID=A0A3A2ZPF9_9EURO|nr:hypothetical protein PHISCL_03507 [Aspergillus sclerotialis]